MRKENSSREIVLLLRKMDNEEIKAIKDIMNILSKKKNLVI